MKTLGSAPHLRHVSPSFGLTGENISSADPLKISKCSPLSSSCFFSPTVFGRPRPLRMGSDWLLARARLLFSMSLVKEESILSLRIRSVLLRLKSSLSEETHTSVNNVCQTDGSDWFFPECVSQCHQLTTCLY